MYLLKSSVPGFRSQPWGLSLSTYSLSDRLSLGPVLSIPLIVSFIYCRVEPSPLGFSHPTCPFLGP